MILHRLKFLVIKEGRPTKFCLLLPLRLRKFIIRLYFAECKRLWNNNLSAIKKDMKSVQPTIKMERYNEDTTRNH